MSRASKKIILPDPSVRSVMIKYLEKTGEINFDKIFNQRLGYLLFKDFCLNVVNEQVLNNNVLHQRYMLDLLNCLYCSYNSFSWMNVHNSFKKIFVYVNFMCFIIRVTLQVPQFKFYEEIKKFEKIDSNDDRRKKAREIYDTFIMRELLSNSGEEK